MFRKPWILALFLLTVLILFGGLMASASPADLESEVGPATTYATTITVDSGLDLDTSGSGITEGQSVTLRRAINEARNVADAARPVLIEFDIPKTCDSYDSDLDIWKIELLGVGTGAPANTTFRALNGDITIDGTTQNGRENGPTIILYGEGATGARNCMVLGGTVHEGGNVIKGLGFQNFRDSITVSSVNNTIEDCWFGLNDAGTAPELRGNDPASGSGDSGVVLTNITTDDNKNLIQNNKFLGLNGTAATIRGRDNTFRDNWIGMAADGTVSNPGCTPDNWLGGGGIVVQNRRHLIEGNKFAGLRFEQFDMSQPPDAIRVTVDDAANSGHTIVDNYIGRAYILRSFQPPSFRADVGTCGRGITLNNHMRGTLVKDNFIVNTSQAGIFLNGGQYNQCELRSNRLRGTTIEYGEGLPDAFAEYLPAKVTSIDGTSVSGTSGDGSPGPNNIIELFLDYPESPIEARGLLGTVTAGADGNWQATLSSPLPDGAGIRTTSTSTQFNGIPGMLAGTTTKLSELYLAPPPVELNITSGMYRQDGAGNFVYWLMDGFDLGEEKVLENPPSDQIADIYCLGEGEHIIFWQADEDNYYPYWVMDNYQKVEEGFLSWHTAPEAPHEGPGWSIAGVHDITGNGEPDVIFNSELVAGVSNVAYWTVEDFVGQGASYLTWRGNVHNVEDWDVGAIADLDYPGTVEVLWQLPDQGEYAYWKMDSNFNATSSGWLLWRGNAHDTLGYTIGGVFDMNNNGAPEIIWQDLGSEVFACWMMEGYNGVGAVLINYDGDPAGAAWEIVGVHGYQ